MLLGSCAGGPTGDAAITGRVKAAMRRDDLVSALCLEVETFRGTVRLSGIAHSREQRNRALALARTVHGVDYVSNGIRIG